jgi:filamentous hemagglutinin family protein
LPLAAGTASAQTAPNTVPTNGTYVAGDGRILPVTPENYLRIEQASQKGIINWGSFSIGSAAHVHFQHDAGRQGLTLNRVVGSNASEIFGRLTANGQVFLVNNAGVLFAPGARVEVGSLFATSLSINDQDFLAGRYQFYNPGHAGSVVNEGHIITPNGYTALVGPQVRNDGIIAARAGSVRLAAGDRVSLDMIGDGLISLSVDQAAFNASVLNAGRIEADGGTVLLAARSANALLDTVINNSGIIRAQSLVERNGEIVLDGGSAGVVAVSGTLEAAGARAGTTGGTVKVLGERVALAGSARLDV